MALQPSGECDAICTVFALYFVSFSGRHVVGRNQRNPENPLRHVRNPGKFLGSSVGSSHSATGKPGLTRRRGGAATGAAAGAAAGAEGGTAGGAPAVTGATAAAAAAAAAVAAAVAGAAASASAGAATPGGE